MYGPLRTGPPRVIAPPPPPRRGGRFGAVPLLAICCLGTILFLIAATIILSLIPLYINRHGNGANQFGQPVFLIFRFLNGTVDEIQRLPDGTVPNDGTNYQNLATQLETAQGLPAGSLIVEELVVSTPQTKRRRRSQFALNRNKRQGSDRRLNCRTRSRLNVCGLLCVLNRLIRSFEQLIIRVFVFTVRIFGIVVEIILIEVTLIEPPAFTRPPTAATLSSAITSSTVASTATFSSTPNAG